MSNSLYPNDPNTADVPPPLPEGQPQPHGQGSAKGRGAIGGVIAAIAILLAKFKFVLVPIVKFFPFILKTGGTMFLSLWFYAQMWGWWYAAGFVLLIFVHECGHLLMARRFGLNVGLPVFIPFMGAVIALKDAPKNAWMEAWVGIGGPLLGTLGAVACDLIFLATGQPLFRMLAYTGFFLNLFNLSPLAPLDGGRVATALSPWLWVIGLVIVGGLAIIHPNFLLFLIIAMSLPRLATLFRKQTDAERRYFELTPSQRLTMAVSYFGLLGFLVVGMHFSYIPPQPYIEEQGPGEHRILNDSSPVTRPQRAIDLQQEKIAFADPTRTRHGNDVWAIRYSGLGKKASA